MNVPFENVRVGDTNLRSHYEEVAVDTLLSIARRKFLIAACVLGAIVLAAWLVSVLPRTYTAQALLYPDVSSLEEGSLESKKGPVIANINANYLVNSEAERIRSQAIAEGVVKSLGLDSNPDFISAPRRSDTLRKLRSSFMPETLYGTQFARAVAFLQSQLSVRSDTHNYVIAVGYTATSPELAATIANAVVFQYLRSKNIDRATRKIRAAEDDLEKLSVVYGSGHPKVVQAVAKLANAKRELQIAVGDPAGSDAERKYSIVLAKPDTKPSGPAGKMILGVASIFGLIAGVCLAIWLDRRDNGFISSDEVAAFTSTRCVGLVPRIPHEEYPLSESQLSRVREVMRAITVSAKLDESEGVTKVAMVTTVGPPEDAARVTEALGRVLVRAGQRVLFVDAGSDDPAADGAGEKLIGLNDVLADEECARAFFGAGEDKTIAVLKRARKKESNDDLFAIRPQSLARFIAAARKHYDVVLIASPLILHPIDTALFGRESDVSLLVARWNRTPRSTVNLAIKQLRDYGVQVNGVVLTDVS